RWCRVGGRGGAAGGVTVSVAVLVAPLYDAVMTIDVDAATDDVVMLKLPVNDMGGTVTLAGTLATVGSLLDSDTTAPGSGPGTLRTMVPIEPLPPTTDAGLRFIVESVAGGGGACGVKVRTADHGPAVPA